MTGTDAPRDDAEREQEHGSEHRRLEAVAQAATDVRDRFSSRTHAAARWVAQRLVLKPTIWSITDVTVVDRDRLDGVRGGFVVVANHSSHLDAPLVLGALPGRLARYLATGAAADYFFDVRWRRQLTELFFNAFPVQRARTTQAGTASVVSGPAAATGGPGATSTTVGAASAAGATTPARKRAAAATAARKRRGQPTVSARSLLERGYPVLVFPEGTRSKTGEVGPFKPGAAALAVTVGVPVVPLALIGAHLAHPRGSRWPRPGRLPVGVAFGDPMRPLEGETASAFSERVRAEILRLKDANTARILGPQNPSEGARP
ncbi:lysophospholipid acyltransferase family protein [Frigoribacterium salinisoli]